MHVNPTGVAIIGLGLIAGYAFGGIHGVGIASVILLLLQLF